jgi:recombination protein RecA
MNRHADRAAALAALRVRWGSAAPRLATEVFGALAAASLPAEAGAARPLPGEPARAIGRPISSGFAELDGLLAGGGLPRTGTVVLRGSGSSGATTLALRAVAEAQAGGALAAWVDLSRSLDPVEAVGRGVGLEWLAVLAPASLDEAIAMAGSLLQGRVVEVLVLDLAEVADRAATRSPAADGAATRSPAADGAATGSPAVVAGSPARAATGSPAARRAVDGERRPPSLADRLARLVAFARRAGALLLVLEPAEAPAALRAVLAEGSSLALELRRTGWIRLGREVVGQRTEVRVAKDRHGAPDRRTTLRLLYAEGGPRDSCLARDELLAEEPVAGIAPGIARRAGLVGPHRLALAASTTSFEPDRSTDAYPPPLLAPPRATTRPAARPIDPRLRPADPRRAAVG